MKLLSSGKDGGQYSTVTGFWLCEFKRLFSIVLLRFNNGSREAYHSHAFNSISWVIKGKLVERHLDGSVKTYIPSLKPITTKTDTFHKVESVGVTWVFSLRGPWESTWEEYLPAEQRKVTLASGRVEI